MTEHVEPPRDGQIDLGAGFEVDVKVADRYDRMYRHGRPEGFAHDHLDLYPRGWVDGRDGLRGDVLVGRFVLQVYLGEGDPELNTPGPVGVRGGPIRLFVVDDPYEPSG